MNIDYAKSMLRNEPKFHLEMAASLQARIDAGDDKEWWPALVEKYTTQAEAWAAVLDGTASKEQIELLTLDNRRVQTIPGQGSDGVERLHQRLHQLRMDAIMALTAVA